MVHTVYHKPFFFVYFKTANLITFAQVNKSLYSKKINFLFSANLSNIFLN